MEDESKCGVCGHEAADADELETHETLESAEVEAIVSAWLG